MSRITKNTSTNFLVIENLLSAIPYGIYYSILWKGLLAFSLWLAESEGSMAFDDGEGVLEDKTELV